MAKWISSSALEVAATGAVLVAAGYGDPSGTTPYEK